MIEDRFIRGGYSPASSHAFARLLLRWPDKPISFLGEGNPVVAEMADRVHIDEGRWFYESESVADDHEFGEVSPSDSDGFKTYFVCVIRPDEEESVWEFEFQTQAELDAFRQGVEAFGTWEMHEGQWDFEEFNSMEAAIARQKELLSELDQDEQ